MEEVWGCATNPINDNEYVTSGDDCMVFKRNVELRRLVCLQLRKFLYNITLFRILFQTASVRLQGKLRGICYSPDAKYITVGNDHGDVII